MNIQKIVLCYLALFGTIYDVEGIVKNEKSKLLRIKLPVWKPKTSFYNPKRVDWAGVISGCRAACNYDKRLCNFYIRGAAHDALAVSEGFGGADGSLVLTEDELRRSENRYESFAYLLSKNVLALATKYDASAADVIAVCGAVASEYLGGSNIIYPGSDFRVGRFDRTEPNPANALAAANMNVDGFVEFAKKKGLTVEELTALMGSHSLLDEKGCKMANGKYCDPNKQDCGKQKLLMHSLSNLYYKETCREKVRVNVPKVKSNNPLPTLGFLLAQEKCKFTSNLLKNRNMDIFMMEFVDMNGFMNLNDLVTGIDFEYDSVSWYNKETHQSYGRWEYTVNDGWLGEACNSNNTDANTMEVKRSMNAYKNSESGWKDKYADAYKKMMSIGVSWAYPNGFKISGRECPSGYQSNRRGVYCNTCTTTNACPPSCYCKTSFQPTDAFYHN